MNRSRFWMRQCGGIGKGVSAIKLLPGADHMSSPEICIKSGSIKCISNPLLVLAGFTKGGGVVWQADHSALHNTSLLDSAAGARSANELPHLDRPSPTATTSFDVACVGLLSPRGTRDGLLPVSPAFVCVPGGSALSRGFRNRTFNAIGHKVIVPLALSQVLALALVRQSSDRGQPCHLARPTHFHCQSD